MNALKHGLTSPRFYIAALMVAAVPELRLLFQALAAEQDRVERQHLIETLTAAYRATLTDPELAKSIKKLVIQHVRQTLERAPKIDLQSNNQDVKED